MSVMGYTNNFGEISNFGLVFHVNYLKAVKTALVKWQTYHPVNSAEIEAKEELIRSYGDSLRGYNPRALSVHAYDTVIDSKNKVIKGTKWYIKGSECHLWAFRIHKTILVPGQYSSNNYISTKKRLLGLTPLINYRQFKLIEGRFDRIGIEKLSLTQQDLLRDLT